MSVYYNENDQGAAQWLRNLMSRRLIEAGDIDERSITEVSPADLRGYRQVHMFAGIGGWAYATALAGWPRDKELWTASCPCQPFSSAGHKRGTRDARHLWPELARLVAANRPACLVGEQTSSALGYAWFDDVATDLEGAGYTCRAVDIPSLAVGAPHRRQRLW
jgi:DNA (cytosine-5)-methyltransferase 1